MSGQGAAMRVAFRTDASIEIGNGHVMRCLTLAGALREQGVQYVFVCRAHDGNLIDYIAGLGFEAIGLARGNPPLASAATAGPPHAHWLGVPWAEDAAESQRVISDRFGPEPVDWLVVDHYGLDARWEGAMRPVCNRLMVIDDLADRPHDCDLLLDQSLGRVPEDYAGRVPAAATLLLGSQYALLRPEFADLRDESLARRGDPHLRHLLVTMGGVDKVNATERVLDALDATPFAEDVRITVVMGPHAPWLDAVRARAARMRHATEVRVDVRDMARLMTDSDLAIGAGGSSTWERCALGLPAIQIAVAANQKWIAESTSRYNAAIHGELESLDLILQGIVTDSCLDDRLATMSRNAAQVTDGKGSVRVTQKIKDMLS